MTLNFDYHDIKWSNNEVYALFSGRSREELNRMFEAGKRMPDGGNILKVFDEGGNFLRSLMINIISSFTLLYDFVATYKSIENSDIFLPVIKHQFFYIADS